MDQDSADSIQAERCRDRIPVEGRFPTAVGSKHVEDITIKLKHKCKMCAFLVLITQVYHNA